MVIEEIHSMVKSGMVYTTFGVANMWYGKVKINVKLKIFQVFQLIFEIISQSSLCKKG